MEGPDGCVPIQSSAYGVFASMAMSVSLLAASLATSESAPNLPHAYFCTEHRSGKTRLVEPGWEGSSGNGPGTGDLSGAATGASARSAEPGSKRSVGSSGRPDPICTSDSRGGGGGILPAGAGSVHCSSASGAAAAGGAGPRKVATHSTEPSAALRVWIPTSLAVTGTSSSASWSANMAGPAAQGGCSWPAAAGWLAKGGDLIFTLETNTMCAASCGAVCCAGGAEYEYIR
eukprot:scaffold6677_cov86-Isochrysis_galbana.AAC.2